MYHPHQPLLWLEPEQPFPPIQEAWGPDSPAPGILCAGRDLSPTTLQAAYSNGIFPWYSADQPILWWSPDPRMVLHVDEFRLHPSMKKTLKKFSRTPGCEIRMDTVFPEVIEACSTSPRSGQSGTWIVPEMMVAYTNFHRAGLAHSIEAWVDGQLVGGLYGINIGHAVFGESMFHRATDGSKIALAALVAFCRQQGLPLIDCQQNTRHLASFGAREITREAFLVQIQTLRDLPSPIWQFNPVMWQQLGI